MSKYKAEDLVDDIESVFTIYCNGCKVKGQDHMCDDWMAADKFFRDGWRKTKSGNIYCPVCATKKLKQS